MSSKNACLRKYSYRTKDSAKAHKRTILSRGGIIGKIYRCEHCGEWHLSSWQKENISYSELSKINIRKTRRYN